MHRKSIEAAEKLGQSNDESDSKDTSYEFSPGRPGPNVPVSRAREAT